MLKKGYERNPANGAAFSGLIKLAASNVIIQGSDQSRGENAVDVAMTDRPIERIEINTFSEDAQKTEEVRSTDIVPSLVDNPYYTESIVQWLSRPYPVANISWSSTDAAGNRIGFLSFPEALLNIDAIWDKIRNFHYLRAGVKIGVRMNGTKFHYGKVLISWTPQALNISGSHFARTDNVISASGCPHVIVSPSENEVHEFIMPYCVPFSYINLETYGSSFPDKILQNMGTVSVYVLNPLSLGSDTVPPVSISIFASFVDVEVAGYSSIVNTKPTLSTAPTQDLPVDPFVATLPTVPAVPNVEAQMLGNVLSVATSPISTLSRMGMEAVYQLSNPNRELDNLFANSRTLPSPQASQVSGVSVEAHAKAGATDTEAAVKSSRGVISGVAETAAKVLRLMTPIPYLGSYTMGMANIAQVAGNVAKALGYCNPLSQESIFRGVFVNPTLANTHGMDTSRALAVLPNNRVAPALELLGGFPEEQSIYHLASTPSLLTSRTISASDTAGTVLERILVSPMFCSQTALATAPITYPTVLMWTAMPFDFWRGSLKYCIQITASAFHSARIRIAWEPSGDSTAGTTITQANRISHVLDIQEETEFHFVVPYLAALPWLMTGCNGSTSPALEAAGNGVLTISVVNALCHPESPVPSIYFNVWVMAGEDFQVAKPSGLWMSTQYDPPSESGFEDPYHIEPSRLPPIEAQWATREMMRLAPYKPLIPAVGSYDHSICMGEVISSIKDAYKRPCHIEVDMDANPRIGYRWFGALLPRYQALEKEDYGGPSFIDHFRLLFRYARGSYCFKVLNKLNFDTAATPLGEATDVGQALAYPKNDRNQPTSTVTIRNTATDLYDYHAVPTGQIRSSNLSLQPLEVMCPYYADQFGYVNTLQDSDSNRPRVFNSTPYCNLAVSNNTAVYVYPGDDYELAFQVGPPSFTYRSGNP